MAEAHEDVPGRDDPDDGDEEHRAQSHDVVAPAAPDEQEQNDGEQGQQEDLIGCQWGSPRRLSSVVSPHCFAETERPCFGTQPRNHSPKRALDGADQVDLAVTPDLLGFSG